jgi:hypothetical protein
MLGVGRLADAAARLATGATMILTCSPTALLSAASSTQRPVEAPWMWTLASGTTRIARRLRLDARSRDWQLSRKAGGGSDRTDARCDLFPPSRGGARVRHGVHEHDVCAFGIRGTGPRNASRGRQQTRVRPQTMGCAQATRAHGEADQVTLRPCRIRKRARSTAS